MEDHNGQNGSNSRPLSGKSQAKAENPGAANGSANGIHADGEEIPHNDATNGHLNGENHAENATPENQSPTLANRHEDGLANGDHEPQSAQADQSGDNIPLDGQVVDGQQQIDHVDGQANGENGPIDGEPLEAEIAQAESPELRLKREEQELADDPCKYFDLFLNFRFIFALVL